MKAFIPLALAFLSASSAFATGSLFGARSPDDDDRKGSDSDSGSGSGSSSSSATVSGNVTLGAGLTGDSQCGSSMCVSAVVNGSTVQYTLEGLQSKIGWIGMGFGRRMAGTQMVILWANADGSITLSQRQASGTVMPLVVSSPPRVATLQTALSVTSGNPKFVFNIPANSDTSQNIIFAVGNSVPASAAVDATIVEHSDYGNLILDLTKTTSSNNTGSSSGGSTTLPFTDRQRMVVAHAIILTVAFLIILPAGALLPRYLRTYNFKWFTGHWILQFGIGGIGIVIGMVLGFVAVQQGSGAHLESTHTRLGLGLLVLYLIQIALGAIIHWIKPKSKGRPPQNYLHAVLGLFIIGLSLYQVRVGYKKEWPQTTGRGKVSNGINILFYVWAALLPVAYFLGLALLPRQFRQEKKARESSYSQHPQYSEMSAYKVVPQ